MKRSADPAIPAARLVTDATMAVEDSFDRFAAWCDRTATCALHGRDAGQVWERLVAAAERRAGRPAPDRRGVALLRLRLP